MVNLFPTDPPVGSLLQVMAVSIPISLSIQTSKGVSLRTISMAAVGFFHKTKQYIMRDFIPYVFLIVLRIVISARLQRSNRSRLASIQELILGFQHLDQIAPNY